MGLFGSDVGKGFVKLFEDGGGHVAENGDPSPLMIEQVYPSACEL